MATLPDGAHLDHLRKQAKELLRAYRAGDDAAGARFARSLPAARRRLPDGLRLHDAQSCVAREYGFPSWAELAAHVEAAAMARGDRATLVRRWLHLAYGGDATGTYDAPRPRVAAQLLREAPGLPEWDPFVACGAGQVGPVAAAVAADPAWVHRAGGTLRMPPLVAVTHSRMGALPEFREGLLRCADELLRAGADPNGGIGNRFPPASLAVPGETAPLSALYGAAGVNRDPELTALLLDGGADPNDGESLYHSLENPACTRLLLERGARVGGTNALRRALDMPGPAALELLLAHGGDPGEPSRGGPGRTWGAPLLRGIAVRCSLGHVTALLAAGADPRARTPDGVSAYALAMQTGLVEVAEALRAAGGAEELTEEEAFVAACARGDLTEGRRIRARRPDLPAGLPPGRLRLLPDTVAWGSGEAARVMVELGWPVAARGGDWDATALNLAVFRGDPGMAGFLLDHGASWREGQGYGADVLATLSWASVNEPQGVRDPDWAGCARVMMAHGLPGGRRDPSDAGRVVIDGRSMPYPDEVAEVLLEGGDGG